MPEPGWYRDAGGHGYRWHDGETWTPHVSDGDRFRLDPVATDASGTAPVGEPVWLPPPALIPGKRLGPFRASRPSGGFEAAPEGGYEPVTTGNQMLDYSQNYVNEFESRMRRESALLEDSLAILRRSTSLRRLGWILALVAVAASVLAVFLVGRWFLDLSASIVWIMLMTFAAVLALSVFMSALHVIAFGRAIASTLAHLRSVSDGRGTFGRARGGLARLFLARAAVYVPYAGLIRMLYEARAVFAIPASIAEGLTYSQAQARSEDLVAARWGPGTFRAVGIPKLSPWTYVYTRSRLRFGTAGPYLALLPFLLIAAAWVLAFLTESVAVVLTVLAVTFGGIMLVYIVWSVSIAPLLHGILRAFLYRYAVTGEAIEPFEAPALHACLREEMRAELGLEQRTPDPDRSVPNERGLPAAFRSLVVGGADYLEQETGIARPNIADVIRGIRELRNDTSAILRVLRDAGATGVDADALVERSGLDLRRCRTAVIVLGIDGKVRPVDGPAGRTHYTAVR